MLSSRLCCSIYPLCVCIGLSCVWLCETPWTVACQVPLPMGFPRQEYWSGLPFPPAWVFPNPGMKPMSPAWVGRFFITEYLAVQLYLSCLFCLWLQALPFSKIHNMVPKLRPGRCVAILRTRQCTRVPFTKGLGWFLAKTVQLGQTVYVFLVLIFLDVALAAPHESH